MADLNITIPPEALEAAAEAEAWAHFGGGSQVVSWEHAPHWIKNTCRAHARAACLAMLKAWPGMHHYAPNAEPYYGKHIILPLPKEPSND